MRITWVTRSFLDYRIPVYKAISEDTSVEFKLIASSENHITPQRCLDKVISILGQKVSLLKGEKCLGQKWSNEQRSNTKFRVFWQPDLIKEIKNTNPDVVITDAFNHWTLSVLWLKFRGAKFKHIVCYERTKHTERNAPFLKKKIIKFFQRYIDAVHCNGELCKEFLLSLDYPVEKLYLGNMAADTEGLINALSEINQTKVTELNKSLNIQKCNYLFVGSLIPRKGVTELLISWKEANLKDASLIILGDGILRNEIEDLLISYQIMNVTIVGSISYDEISLYYKIADCFIIPTLEDNWSLVVPEAMSCKLPIICSVYNGCYPELVKPENGWVFDPLDKKSFVETLIRSHKNKDKFKLMGLKSFEIVQSYTPERIASKLIDTCIKLFNNE